MSDEALPAPEPIVIGLIEEGTSDLAQAIERYDSLKSNSGAGNNLAIIALIVFVISCLIGFIALYDAIFNGGSGNAIETCFGGLFIAAALGAGALAQSVLYQVQLKEALTEVKASANIPKDEATSHYHRLPLSVVGGVALCIATVAGLLGISIEGLVALVVGLIVLLVSMIKRS